MSRIFSEADPLLRSGADEAVGIKSTPEEEHAYSRRMMGCPCPAIAAMINHSYLNPRDDEDPLPFFQLVKALQHDASITRYNASEGDYLDHQCELVDEFIDGIHYPAGLDEAKKMITLEICKEERIGEAALALQAFADKSSPLYTREICARADWLRIWYKEERFPLELGWENRRDGYKIR
ncbi:hypothetical protein PGTUg99_000053 [Puccinia graminis f. sp. tritici]|uniref:Heme haloperoxidase family profile domain-containing protein n=1 Tax=Puccinia graminis f. sp. tritici TaxID=56615 RepID=A0A5B0QYJ7_PUCGR|nr:hypothetical protein PGTUg99_000053 [Puccinia graminis f. sp. tritici]